MEYIDELEYSVMGTFVNSEKKVVNELIKAVKQLDEQLREIQNYRITMNKEEIEKSKERCNSIVEFCKNNKECQENNICSDCYIEIEDIRAIETLLQYIQELEISNKELDKENNRLEKIEFERDKANKIIDEMADIIKDYDIDYSDICKYRFVRHCEKAPTGCKECIKQYFEKKVEEK